ncbi:MAG: crossover junction endodeoxyribonuclease RuvC [Gammaproteobacteria bacterium]|nr:crossover junction endodeoxyribonuclease RuvC [Gammaproteobacteria bacterium]
MGIDPGSRVTGFGLIEVSGDQTKYQASGCIRTGKMPFNARLEEIYSTVAGLIAKHTPGEICLEKIFMHRNADSALKLGHARAAALCAVFANHAIVRPELAEYSPREIKQAVAGYGAADKQQVQIMVRRLLALSGDIQADAADALAVALCHANSRRTAALLAGHREAVR